MKNLNITRCALLTLCVSVLVVQYSWSTPKESEAYTTQTFAVENMTCAACPITVRKAMLRVKGVQQVDVNFEKKTVTATFDPAIASPTVIAEASSVVGFPARPIEELPR